MAYLDILQDALGWIYFIAWSATFWPQVILNYRRKTTAGLSTDFVAINIVGFISYVIFTFSSYTVKSVAKSYVVNTGYPPQVELTDVLFAAHGSVMCVVLVLQLFMLPPRTPPKRAVLVGALIFQTLVVIGLVGSVMGRLDWYKYLQFAGGIKVLSAVIKHFPQVLLNRARGSTVGWSYTMVLLDVVGGSFSVAQQVVRCIKMGSTAPFTSNIAKTFLAAESLLFDFFFIAQHVWFYPDRTDIDQDARRKQGDDLRDEDLREEDLRDEERSPLVL